MPLRYPASLSTAANLITLAGVTGKGSIDIALAVSVHNLTFVVFVANDEGAYTYSLNLFSASSHLSVSAAIWSRSVLEPFSRLCSVGGPSRRCRRTAGSPGCAGAALMAGVALGDGPDGPGRQLVKRMPRRSGAARARENRVDAVIEVGPPGGSDRELLIDVGPPGGSDWELDEVGAAIFSSPFLAALNPGFLLGRSENRPPQSSRRSRTGPHRGRCELTIQVQRPRDGRARISEDANSQSEPEWLSMAGPGLPERPDSRNQASPMSRVPTGPDRGRSEHTNQFPAAGSTP